MTGLHFSDESVDRGEAIRGDAAALAALMQGEAARFVRLKGGRVRVAQQSPMALVWEPWREVQIERGAGAELVFLGTLHDVPRFAVIPAEQPQTIDTRPRDVKPDGEYVGMFAAGVALAPDEAQMAAHAIHLANWINRTRFCGRCSGAMTIKDGGHRRQCTNEACKWQEFPRTDPVVLALVTKGDRCILARQPRFPPGFYAPLAGFVAPAEHLEAAVRREVREEVGVRVGDVIYQGSQPWPFPGSLMIGFLATALDDEIAVDGVEIEAAEWFTRDEVAMLARNEPVRGRSLNLPPRGVVGRLVIDRWLGEA